MPLILERLLSRTLSPQGSSFIADQIWSRRFKFTLFFILSLFAALLEMTGVGLVYPLLILIIAPDNIDRFRILVWIADDLGVGRGMGLSIFLIVLIGLIMVCKNAYMLFFNRMQLRTMARWKTALSSRLMRVYLFSDYRIHLVKTSSEIIRNISLTTAVFDQFMTAIINFISSGLILTALCILLAIFLPPHSLYGMMVIIAAAILLYYVMRRPFEEIGAEMNILFQRRQSTLRQSIGMIKETKLMAREDFFLSTFVNIESQNFGRQAHNNFLSVIPALAIEGTVILAILGMVGFILLTSSDQSIGLALLGLMAATLFRAMPIMNRILTSLRLMNLSRNSVEIIASELNELEKNIYQPGVESTHLPFEKSLSLDRVSYSYPSGSSPALMDISFDIKRNRIIGITGPSGSGKSTLATIIMGLLLPEQGEVRVDGTPLSTPESLRAWHRHIGYVPQSVFLIEDSIARNVAFAASESEFDEDRILSVLEIVQLKEFVETLPKGIHNFVGEDGNRLSGGQRQRLGIARALYNEPDVLVFDEATSLLDAAIEHAFTDSLMRLRGSRTMIIIAHRLSTLRCCDEIIMLDQGKILDMASFDILAHRCPQFKRLVELSRLEKVSA